MILSYLATFVWLMFIFMGMWHGHEHFATAGLIYTWVSMVFGIIVVFTSEKHITPPEYPLYPNQVMNLLGSVLLIHGGHPYLGGAYLVVTVLCYGKINSCIREQKKSFGE